MKSKNKQPLSSYERAQKRIKEIKGFYGHLAAFIIVKCSVKHQVCIVLVLCIYPGFNALIIIPACGPIYLLLPAWRVIDLDLGRISCPCPLGLYVMRLAFLEEPRHDNPCPMVAF